MEPPKIKSVLILSARPEAADLRKLEHLQANADATIQPVVILVRVELEGELPATSAGFDLYVGDERIMKYTQCRGGIYFKVHDPSFLERHKNDPVRFLRQEESAGGAAASDAGAGNALAAELFVASDVRLPGFARPTAAVASDAGLPTIRDALAQ